ncbi:hypothetical protein ABZ721_14015 [Streptomyces sp. NPDC006733]|uniref:hypothetical protein n=1 Tax=Streptomyces sp. NPDC006733 TaxID=3155460 RepID=UPI0033D50F85
MPSHVGTRLATLFLLGALALVGCGPTEAGTGAIDTASDAKTPACRAHQTVLPSEDYSGGKEADMKSVLTMLRYYTAKGALPFCDGKPANEQDTAWVKLYTYLTKP